MKNPSIKTLRKKLKKVCHEYIRKRDCGGARHKGKCCTCGKPLMWNSPSANAGHFVAVGTATQGTEYDERNMNLQCVYCNNWGEGKKPEYSLFLIAKYGQGIVEELIKQSKWSLVEFAKSITPAPREIGEDTRNAYEFLIEHYREKLDAL